MNFIGKIFIFVGSSRSSATTVTGDDAEPHGQAKRPLVSYLMFSPEELKNNESFGYV